MADAAFEHPRLAAIYDALDPDRSDLDVYVSVAEELGARQALDVGCGTGTFALLLAERGLDVVGVVRLVLRWRSPVPSREPSGCAGSTEARPHSHLLPSTWRR